MATEAQARIDEEITKQILSLCNLRTRRNTFSPISRLPTETLATIFIHCARDYHCKARGQLAFTPAAPRWVNISYVCRHWRDVALNCPTLWTYVFIVSQRWTEELLVRSKQASLKLQVNPGFWEKRPRGLYLVEQVMNHVERIQELHLYLPSTLTHEVLPKLSSHAPRLEILNVWVIALGDPPGESFVLFDGDTPALRTLDLTDCPTPLHSFQLSGLTTLSLHSVHHAVRFQQSVMGFLATLSCMPDLKHLYLEDTLASATGFLSSSAFNIFHKINLPHLSRLLVTAPLSTIIALLSCVNIPLKTEVRLKCISEDDSSDAVDYTLLLSLSSLLAQRFSISALHSPTIRSLVIESAGWEESTLTFSGSERDCNSSDCISHRDWGCNRPLKIAVDQYLSMTNDGDHTISNLCCSIPSTSVQSLHVIDSQSQLPPAFWRKMLGHFQDLRYIKLSEGDISDLAPLLSATDLDDDEGVENQGGHTPSDRDHMLVPRLEELELSCITFPPRGDSDMPGPITQPALFDVLSTRNAPQGRLAMTECDIDGFDLPDMVLLWDELVCERAVTPQSAGSDFDHD